MERRTWLLVEISLVGILTEFALTRVSPASFLQPLEAAHVLLLGFAAWVSIHTKHYGYITFVPVVSIPMLLIIGLPQTIVALVSAQLIILAFQRSLEPIVDHATRGSEEILSTALSGAVASSVMVSGMGQIYQLLIMIFVFLASDYLLRGLRIRLVDGIGLSVLFVPMLMAFVPWYAFVSLVVVINYGLQTIVGPVGHFLGTIVFAQIYYPWKLLDEQRNLFLRSLQVISLAVDLKDPYTSHHSHRVAQYAVKIARAMRTREEDVERIRIGGLMHDIGKIGVPTSIIRKPAKLTTDEMSVMKSHAELGADVIAELDVLNEAAPIVRHHHENYDGSGYPEGLSGEDIPLGSRAILVADAFDALTTDRPYRKGRGRQEALEEIEKHEGTQFDPKAVAAFRRALRA